MELWFIVSEISFYRSSLVLKVSLLIATAIALINRVIAKLRNCFTNKTVPPHRSQDFNVEMGRLEKEELARDDQADSLDDNINLPCGQAWFY